MEDEKGMGLNKGVQKTKSKQVESGWARKDRVDSRSGSNCTKLESFPNPNCIRNLFRRINIKITVISNSWYYVLFESKILIIFSNWEKLNIQARRNFREPKVIRKKLIPIQTEVSNFLHTFIVE